MLTCSAIYVTVPLVLPMEVVHLIIHVEDLTVSSSEEAEVVHSIQELELGVGNALGLSLSEVH
jgi:hypothetical protein